MPPSVPYFQPDHAAPVIQDFLEWLPKNYTKGTNGPSATLNRPFMPLPDLRTYLNAENRITKLLIALHVDGLHRSLIETLGNHYIRVFTILTIIGKGGYIGIFLQHRNLRDSQLPFLERPAHFPVDPNCPTFWDLFFKEQFTFCPHVFGINENHLRLEDACILPIISKEVLAQGGSAAIYKIKLHPHYDKLGLVGDASRAHSPRPANTYVLKTYNTKDAERYYENEVDAFMKLNTRKEVDESLIKLLGSYKQGGTYNILLEYADRGTLEEFFQYTQPPTLGEDIIVFWRRLFNVIKALQRIHKTERPDGFHGPDILIGWHQDVKPKNILVLSGNGNSPYDVEFKLGDLGLSHFKRTLKMDRKIVDSDVGGTKDYGAPECHRSDEFLEQTRLDVKPSIDIWSFGGVCSEAAVWVVLGMSGLNRYRHQRKQEICERRTNQDGCCFHDGEELLETVDTMHHRLLTMGEIRPGDHVTGPVLDHMVRYMLQKDPDMRDDAVKHWKNSKRILEEAEKKVEKLHKQINPRESYPAGGSNSQDYGRIMPTTPPQPSHETGQASHDNTPPHAPGPPPKNRPRQGSNNVTSAWSPYPEQRLGRRSDTWHVGPNSNSSELASPSIINQPLKASPPVEERPELFGTNSDEAMTVFDKQNRYANESMPFSSRELRNEPQSVREFPPAENNVDARYSNGGRHSVPVSIRSDGSAPVSFQGDGTAVGTHLEKASQASNLLPSESTGYENNPTVTDITSNKANQRPPPKLANAWSTSNPPSAPTPTELPVPTTKPEMPEKPYLSFEDAKKIRIERRGLPPEHQDLLNDLKHRDHAFLIDDSLSMGSYWHEVIALFSVLAYIVKRLDDNGLDMYFTVSTAVKHFKDTKGAISHLEYMSPSTYSNIDSRLQQILGRYQENFGHQKEWKSYFGLKSRVKPLSLYVFTDAAWQGCDAVAPIEAMIEKQRQLGLPKEQVSIQFIRFGNHTGGIRKLKYLDSGLRKKYTKKWDIVDTEPFQGGNLLKMLLGATFPWFDGDDDDEEDV